MILKAVTEQVPVRGHLTVSFWLEASFVFSDPAKTLCNPLFYERLHFGASASTFFLIYFLPIFFISFLPRTMILWVLIGES